MNEEKIETREMEEGNLTNLNTQPLTSTINKEEAMETKKGIVNINTANGKEVSEMKVETVDINSIDIKYHPRKNLGDIERLQNSIKRDGLQEPLLVYEAGDNQYAVIDGYRRLTAIKEFGWKTVPCFIKKDIAEAQAAHLSYAKNAERSSFDPIEIASHLKAMMQEFGYSLRDLELKGYGTPPSISNKIKLLDLPESVQKQIQEGNLTAAHGLHLLKLQTKKEQQRMAKRIVDHDLTARKTERQIYRYLSKGKRTEKRPKVQVPSTDIPGVYIKDSRDMSELPDKSVHLIVSSPPYNIGMEFEKGITFDEHLEMVRDVLKECARVLVPGGIMALNVDDINSFKGNKGNNPQVQMQLMGHKYQNYLRKHQIFLTDLIIWQKSNAWNKRRYISYTENTVHTSYRILDNFEPVYIFRKKGQRELPSAEVALKSRLTREEWIAWTPALWQITPVRNMEDHPCVWPEELPRRLIRMFSYEGDTVLDPWLGSGTTVKVSRDLNRNGVGYEREPQYKAVILKKLGTGSAKTEAQSLITAMAQNIARMDAAETAHFCENADQEGASAAESQEPVAAPADSYADGTEATSDQGGDRELEQAA